jgi:hypothetical protein
MENSFSPHDGPDTSLIGTPNKFGRLHEVTSLSKYLAMLLFILLPFLGGYVGYEIGKGTALDTQDSLPVIPMTATVSSEPTNIMLASYLDTHNLDAVSINSGNGELFTLLKAAVPSTVKIGENIHVKKLSDEYALIDYVYENQLQKARLFDLKTNQVIRTIEWSEHPLSLDLVLHPANYIDTDPVIYGVTCAAAVDCKPTVYEINLLTGVKKALYVEERPQYRLAEACELGCSGLFYQQTDGSLILGLYEPVDRIMATFKEVLVIPVTQ